MSNPIPVAALVVEKEEFDQAIKNFQIPKKAVEKLLKKDPRDQNLMKLKSLFANIEDNMNKMMRLKTESNADYYDANSQLNLERRQAIYQLRQDALIRLEVTYVGKAVSLVLGPLLAKEIPTTTDDIYDLITQISGWFEKKFPEKYKSLFKDVKKPTEIQKDQYGPEIEGDQPKDEVKGDQAVSEHDAYEAQEQKNTEEH